MNPLKLATVIVGVLAIIFLAASCGGNAWLTSDTTAFGVKISRERGLWKSCTSGGSSSTCVTISNDGLADWYKAVRAFSILAVLAAIGAVIGAILSLVTEKFPGILTTVAFTVAAVCGIIGLAIFSSKKEGGDVDYGWSYIIGWVGVVVSVGGTILSFVASKQG